MKLAPYGVAAPRGNPASAGGQQSHGASARAPVLKPCIKCGVPCRGSRCAKHALPPRGAAHRRARAQTLPEEFVCWLCGRPATPDDPLVGTMFLHERTAAPTSART
jgi:hypothetical protein